MNRHNFPEQTEERLLAQIDRVVRVFQNLDPLVLQYKPAPGAWSMAECFAHLNSYGEYYLPRLKELISKGSGKEKNSGVYRPGRIASWLIRRINPDTGRAKMKAAGRHLPGKISDPSLLVAIHLEQQEELLRLLRSGHGTSVNRACIPVSVMPLLRLSAGDIMVFLTEHNERHLRQAEAVLEHFTKEK